MLLGAIIPFLFATSYAFLTDNLPEFFYTFEQNIISPINHFKTNYVLQVFLGFLIILTILASLKLLQQYDTRKVSSRKYYLVFLFIFIFSIVSFLFVPATSQEMLVISIIPVTFLISNLFVSIQSGFWGEFLFVLLLIIVVLVQFSDYFIPL
jgi:hypothetical protein